jgi:hypothetical protein
LKRSSAVAELNAWLKFTLDQDNSIENPLKWWLDELEHNPHRFPSIVHIAINLFSAPAMSAECERVFSCAKRTITDEQNRLSAKQIEANKCQKDWLKKKLVISDM